MSEKVEVPFGENPQETATLLLAAAVELELPQDVVATTSEATFVVPAEVYDKVFTKAGNIKKAGSRAATKEE